MPRLGPEAGQSPNELDQLAHVGPADVMLARAAWKRDAPQWAKILLDAKPAPIEES